MNIREVKRRNPKGTKTQLRRVTGKRRKNRKAVNVMEKDRKVEVVRNTKRISIRIRRQAISKRRRRKRRRRRETGVLETKRPRMRGKGQGGRRRRQGRARRRASGVTGMRGNMLRSKGPTVDER